MEKECGSVPQLKENKKDSLNKVKRNLRKNRTNTKNNYKKKELYF